ncbi:MAG: hypothetical protein HY046_10265 [Acidobacteria bacterium]|nr:hypothetical protein [Acidobacteriota bacterium]
MKHPARIRLSVTYLLLLCVPHIFAQEKTVAEVARATKKDKDGNASKRVATNDTLSQAPIDFTNAPQWVELAIEDANKGIENEFVKNLMDRLTQMDREAVGRAALIPARMNVYFEGRPVWEDKLLVHKDLFVTAMQDLLRSGSLSAQLRQSKKPGSGTDGEKWKQEEATYAAATRIARREAQEVRTYARSLIYQAMIHSR